MKTTFNYFAITVLTAFLLTLAAPVIAQDGPPGDIAEMWVMHVDSSRAGEFESAFKQHLALRTENEDPFNWQVFMANTGDSLGTYYVRTCCFAWSGRDDYEAWEASHPQVQEHWNADVHPNVSSYEHHFEQMDFANSYWPADMPVPKFVGVTDFKIKQGGYREFNAAKEAMSQIAINEGWGGDENQWAWGSMINGPAVVSLVIPYSDYADMADPDTTFFEFLTEQAGAEEAGAIFERFNSAIKGSRYEIYTHRPDLSTSE